MIQIALLLFGDSFVRSRAKYVMFIGCLWGMLGLAIFIDGLSGVTYFPLHSFGAFLLLESLVTLAIASSGIGTQKALLYFKGGVFCVVALLILSNKSSSNLLLAILFGFAYFIIGLFIIFAAWIVRFAQWKMAVLHGLGHIAFALFMMNPYPTHYKATVSLYLGTLILSSGINTAKFAWRIMTCRAGMSVFELLMPQDRLYCCDSAPQCPQDNDGALLPQTNAPLIIHIWTPVGTASASTLRRPVINRYIAAVDTQGIISMGHAAVELSSDIYISLYPVDDIDRSPSAFLNVLRATPDNDVPGRFQPDYAQEALEWCDSDRKIYFYEYNRQALMRFWNSYQRNTTYNLTYRNCSSTVAYALEAALDGVLARQHQNGVAILKTLMMPELWIAAQMRKRALSMAWTPGLVMDYANALRNIIHPVSKPWYQRLHSWVRAEPRAKKTL